jgi:hypothetical protein
MSKVNAELLTLTYGSMVMQLIRDYEDVRVINTQLEKMGYNIGCRLIDEFLAKSGITACGNFRETVDIIAKVAFKMFLGLTVDVGNWNAENSACSLIFSENPLIDFVELPPQYAELQYCNLLCGVIRGALEMVQLQIDSHFVKDVLRGDDVSEMRLELKGVVRGGMSEEYRDS